MILPVCVSVHCLHAVPRGQERVEDPLELEKWAAVNRSLGVGKQTWVLWKSNSAPPPQDRFSVCSPG
ncbi:hypothetical protein ACRRTK_006403 [Alexandromys fortis]